MQNSLLSFVCVCILSTTVLTEQSVELKQSQPNQQQQQQQQLSGRCEPITVPMCKSLPYNLTHMPNQFNHQSQQEAAMEAHQFWALVEINCSTDLRFFLCSLYTPICIESYAGRVRPCRSVCVRARLGCERYMKKFSFEWPEHMSCELFPAHGDEMCMDPREQPHHNQQQQQAGDRDISSTLALNHQLVTAETTAVSIEQAPADVDGSALLDTLCLKPFIRLESGSGDPRYGKLATSSLLNCVQPCESIYFDVDERLLARRWLLFWSLLCALSSAFTTLTYVLRPSRFRYPERPIVYLCACYALVSVGYMMSYTKSGNGESLACDGRSARYSHTSSPSGFLCVLQFMLVYYFSTAASLWWIVASLTWFLAAGLKWGAESIARYSATFHAFVWLVPLVKSFLILLYSQVDADTLVGVCHVGNMSLRAQRVYLLAPAVIYLLVGIGFLVAGFVSLFRVRNMIIREQRQQQKKLLGQLAVGAGANSSATSSSSSSTSPLKAHKLEKLMIRIGIFSILYTVPAACLIACYIYEQLYRDKWERNALCRGARRRRPYGYMSVQLEQLCGRPSAAVSGGGGGQLAETPELFIFLLKYFMCLIVGVTSGFWIWTKKTISLWSSSLSSCFCCCDRSKRSKQQAAALKSKSASLASSMSRRINEINNVEPSSTNRCSALLSRPLDENAFDVDEHYKRYQGVVHSQFAQKPQQPQHQPQQQHYGTRRASPPNDNVYQWSNYNPKYTNPAQHTLDACEPFIAAPNLPKPVNAMNAFVAAIGNPTKSNNYNLNSILSYDYSTSTSVFSKNEPWHAAPKIYTTGSSSTASSYRR
jgi:frizzled 5/8